MDFDSLVDDSQKGQPVASQGATGAPAVLPSFDALQSDEDKYGGLGEQAKTLGEGALDAATLGLGTAAEGALLGNEQDIRRRREVNPLASAVGQSASPVPTPFIGEDGPHGSSLEKLKTFGEGALEGGTLGFGNGLESYALGNSKEQLERREANPGVFTEGQITGVVAPALLGDEAGVAGVLGKAGDAGTAALGLGGEGAGLASRITAAAVKSGIEGAIFAGGDEVSKMLLSDPKQSAQTAVANIGLGGVLGGVLGGGLGATGELWSATVGKKLGSSLDAAANAITDSGPTPSGPVVEDSARPDLAKAVGDLKPNASQIENDYIELGIKNKPSAGTLSADKSIQGMEAQTSKNPTIMGRLLDNDKSEVTDALKKNVNDLLQEQTVKTEAQVGREIKDGVKAKLEAELKPIEDEFTALKPHFQAAEISPEAKEAALDPLLNHEYVKADDGMKDLADKLADKIRGVKNVDELKTQRTFLNAKKDEAFRAGAPEAQLYKAATDALTDLRTSALNEASASGKIPEDIAGRIQSNDALYASYKKNLQALGVEGGLGRVGSARDLLTKFGKLSDESLATKFFDLNDVNQLNYFKQEFPEQFDLARRYKLREIAEKSTSEAMGRNGEVDVGKFLGQVSDKKINPEARDILFNGRGQKLNAIQNVYRNIPGDINPSGTATSQVFGRLFTPAGIADNLSDAAKYAYLKAQPFLREAAETVGGGTAGEMAALKVASSAETASDPEAFKQMAAYIGNTVRGDNLITKAAKNIFQGGVDVLPAHLATSLQARNKLDEKLKDLQANSQDLFDVSGKLGHYMPDHGAAVAQTAMNGVNYLNSLRPNTGKASPLDNAMVPSQPQVAAFNRALDIANQPLLTLKAAKDGTLTVTDMKHLMTLYPDLYRSTSQKVHNELITATSKGVKIPYKTRLGLSMFVGQPLDSTMTAPAIRAAQPMMPQTPQSQQAPHMSHSAQSMKGLTSLASSYQTPDQARQARNLRR